MNEFCECLLQERQGGHGGGEGWGVEYHLPFPVSLQQGCFFGVEVMPVGVNPILLRPSRLHHLEIVVLPGQGLESSCEVRALREIGIEIATDYPVAFFLPGVPVKDLNFHPW